MKSRYSLIAIVIGIICGFLSTHILLIGWYNLFFWAAVGILIGWFGKEKKTTLWAGAWYGFFMSMSFLLSGFQGSSDKFFSFVIFSLGLSIVGALGGMLTAWIGYSFSKKKK